MRLAAVSHAKGKGEDSTLCPCGAKQAFEVCCQPVIAQRSAPTAEALMRSRYVAFTHLDTDYLLATWHPAKRPRSLELDEQQRWLGLRIIRTEAGQPDDNDGVVEFVARYKVAGKGYRLHEVSRFAKVEGQWCYVDGEFLAK